MRTLIAILALFPALLHAAEESLDTLLPQFALVERLEKLSQEKRYEEIFDSLSSDYRRGVEKESWVKTSKELGWVITKARIGTFSKNGDFADAPVRSLTLIGKKTLHIDAVAYFVREDGVWRLWSFPFVNPHLMDRPSWPPPIQRAELGAQPTSGLRPFLSD